MQIDSLRMHTLYQKGTSNTVIAFLYLVNTPWGIRSVWKKQQTEGKLLFTLNLLLCCFGVFRE